MPPKAAPGEATPPKAAKGPLRLPLIGALALAFVSLALISGIAYIVVLAGATGTAERLLVDRAARVVEGQVATIKNRLDPITEQLELIAALAAAGRVDIDSPVAVREALAVLMGRVPEISVAAFATLDQQLHRAFRRPDGTIGRDTVSILTLPRSMERFRQLQTSHSTFWGELFWSNTLKQPLILDGRNLYDPALLAALGIDHEGIGRGRRSGGNVR